MFVERVKTLPLADLETMYWTESSTLSFGMREINPYRKPEKLGKLPATENVIFFTMNSTFSRIQTNAECETLVAGEEYADIKFVLSFSAQLWVQNTLNSSLPS